jgi:hypothetical protein
LDLGKRWSEEERTDVQSVIKALGTGSFTAAVVALHHAALKKGGVFGFFDVVVDSVANHDPLEGLHGVVMGHRERIRLISYS